jgi:hypothetical protein
MRKIAVSINPEPRTIVGIRIVWSSSSGSRESDATGQYNTLPTADSRNLRNTRPTPSFGLRPT